METEGECWPVEVRMNDEWKEGRLKGDHQELLE